MRKAKELRRRLLARSFALALTLGVLGIGFSMASLVAYAAGQATVTSPNGAKIRQEATTSSTMVGGAEKGKVLTVLSQVQGSDGYIWYQVQVNDTTTGYVRSDLVDITGDVPTEGAGEGGEGGEAAPPVEMIQVNPVSASVSGEAEIRDSASSAGQVLGTVPVDTVITVTGYGMDADSYTWYQVRYNSEGTEVEGFLPADSCILSDDLVPLGQEPTGGEDSPEPTQPTTARYQVVEKDGTWLLVDNETDPTQGYPIQELFDGAKKNEEAYRSSEQKVKTQKIIIIILVFLLVAAVAGIAFLVFKIRDMMDSAYFNEVENETLRRKNASSGQSKQKASMHTVGPEKQSARPAGTRPTGSVQRTGTAAGQRPGNAQRSERMAQDGRSVGSSTVQRSAGQGTRPVSGTQGMRPAGSTQSARPVGSTQGARPAGTRPVGQGTRPTGSAQGTRPAGTAQGTRRADGAQDRAPQGARPGQNTQKAQPKNFMADDEEFEFEFLNYDGDDEQ